MKRLEKHAIRHFLKHFTVTWHGPSYGPNFTNRQEGDPKSLHDSKEYKLGYERAIAHAKMMLEEIMGMGDADLVKYAGRPRLMIVARMKEKEGGLTLYHSDKGWQQDKRLGKSFGSIQSAHRTLAAISKDVDYTITVEDV